MYLIKLKYIFNFDFKFFVNIYLLNSIIFSYIIDLNIIYDN
jgi:hypothetical protein